MIILSLLAFSFLLPSIINSAAGEKKSVFETVMERGEVNCGVHKNLLYFSKRIKQNGGHTYEGIDADYCRVIAVVLFNDPEKVKFIAVDTNQRFSYLNDGKVDVVIRNSTATIGRELDYNVTFGPTIFYDTPAIMVRDEELTTSDPESWKEKSICVQIGTTTDRSIKKWATRNGVIVKNVNSLDESIHNAHAIGYLNDKSSGCFAFASDRSQLLARLPYSKTPLKILDVVVGGKEPLAPMYKSGDVKWSRVVDYAIYATIYAAEISINKHSLTNVSIHEPENNSGKLSQVGAQLTTNDICYIADKMSLDNYFVYNIVSKVGNYNDIYEKYIPRDIIDRGYNQPYTTKPGLLYSLPFTVDDVELKYKNCNLKLWIKSEVALGGAHESGVIH